MASSFAQGFGMGSDMYDSAERMKLLKEQQQWAREEAEAKRGERQREADIRTAGAETLSMEGKPVEYLGGTGIDRGPQPADAQTALRSDIATAPAKMYTAEQAQQDYLKRLRGIDVGKAMQYEKGSLELGELKRSARYAQKQEDALGFQQNIMSDIQKNGGDAAAVIEKHFLPLYNEDKLPGFKDGGKAKLVPSAMGGDKSIVITYKDGKQETMPADMKTLEELTKHTQMQMMASSTPENFWKAKAHFLEERKTTATETSAAASATSAAASATNAATNASELAQKIKADLFGVEARLKGAQAGQASAMANQANAHAAVFTNMVELAKTNKEAGEAVKDALLKYENLTDEEKAGAKGQQVLTEGALAAAKKTGDITGIMNVLKKPDKSHAPEVDPEAKKAAYKELSEVGTDPKAIAAVKAKWSNVFGPTATDKAIAAAVAKRENPTAAAPAPATPAPAPAPAAIPPANAAPTSAVPAAALPINIPPVTSSTIQGPKKYQIKGVIGVFKSPEEAQAAWAQKYAPKAPAMFD